MTTDLWTCGHTAGAECAECAHLLRITLNEQAATIEALRAEIERLSDPSDANPLIAAALAGRSL